MSDVEKIRKAAQALCALSEDEYSNLCEGRWDKVKTPGACRALVDFLSSGETCLNTLKKKVRDNGLDPEDYL